LTEGSGSVRFGKSLTIRGKAQNKLFQITIDNYFIESKKFQTKNFAEQSFLDNPYTLLSSL
jgi:hypothetical protein